MLSDAFEWPHLLVRIVAVLLFFGLPLVATLAWYHGHRGQQRVSGAEGTIGGPRAINVMCPSPPFVGSRHFAAPKSRATGRGNRNARSTRYDATALAVHTASRCRPDICEVREQARIQLAGRAHGSLVYELLEVIPDQGFARLPAPSQGDIFLDLEG